MAKPQEEMTTLMLRKADRERLTALALEMGYRWGERGNATRLMEAVARGEVPLTRPQDATWSGDQIEAMLQALRVLVETGQTEHARVLSELLLERSEVELETPLRRQLQTEARADTTAIVARLRECIERRQPFRLSYQDATDRVFEFTILFAEFTIRERRQYLECWVEDATDSFDIKELAANRTLRIDRIPHPVIEPLVEKHWRSEGLATVEVELHLFNRLRYAYEPRAGDLQDDWTTSGGEPVRRIRRRVNNSFWLLREVLAHGEDCLVISPESVRDRAASQAKKLFERYFSASKNQP